MTKREKNGVVVQCEPLALRPKQAAASLGIGVRLLWELTNKGEIPARKIGRCTVYYVEALRGYLAGQAKKSAK